MPKSNMDKPQHFFILGAAKCGTSSLYHYLNQHSEIYLPDVKEPLFFEKEFNRGAEYYWNTNFSSWNGEKMVGEARHRNLYLPYVPERIASTFPNARLLVVVRNPVDRAFSHYNHRRVRGLEKSTFEEAIQLDMERIERGEFIHAEDEIRLYIQNLRPDGSSFHSTIIDSGYYAEQVKRYLKFFDRKQLLIVFLDDLKKDPKRCYFEILRFLDKRLSLIEIDFSVRNKRVNRTYQKVHNYFSNHRNFSRIIKPLKTQRAKSIFLNLTKYFDNGFLEGKQSMRSETRLFLISHYLEHNKALERLTGRDLSHWNK